MSPPEGERAPDVSSRDLAVWPVASLLAAHPAVAAFFSSVGLGSQADGAQLALGTWLERLPDEALLDAGMDRSQLLGHIARLLQEVSLFATKAQKVSRLTLLGGHDKSGQSEPVQLELSVGQVVCIVGPTGSGKSRLLGDIECLAQGDTPTGRRVLVDGQPPSDEQRFSLDRKLVAQLSQNMNFVVDMSVSEFIHMHACCRQLPEPREQAARVLACANELTGEQFGPDVPVTQLSGGQTRALMIADVALLSAAPVVLIDEIENAGVDRQRALELLIRGEKIVLISTHDPLLALRGDARIVIRNGGIAEVIHTSPNEQKTRERIEAMDAVVARVRDRLRRGEHLDEPVGPPPELELLLKRRSHHKLVAPGPGPDELAWILAAAARAPDFRQLRPYRFLAAQGEGLDRLGAAMQRAAQAGSQPADVIERAPRLPHRAPLVIIAVSRTKPDQYASELDQRLSAGSTVLMMHLAARALGFAGVWRSGWYMQSPEFHCELRLEPNEQIVGFLYLGTPTQPDRELPTVDASQFVSWL